MTRLHPAATSRRPLRALVLVCAALLVALTASGCTSSEPPGPTPDPFAGLADRSDQAFRQGLEAYGQGQYRDALTSFESARTLSPTGDPRIDQMIERSKAALAPTPTPAAPTATEVPATPTAVPVLMSTQAPDIELGRRYFGEVTLAVVPGRDNMDAPPATQFFFQDQIGLHIDGLKQHLRLPFTLRVFNIGSSRLVAQVQFEDTAATGVPFVAPKTSTSATPGTPVAAAASLVRFWDTYVWYHNGGEEPGRYRVELFANGTLTNSFDYGVGSVPIPSPEPIPTETLVVEPTPETVPTAVPAPAGSALVAAPSSIQAAPAPAAEVAAPEVATAVPAPTTVPTPTTAYTIQVGGVPAGLDVNWNLGRFYLADASGVIWTTDSPTGQERPTLGTPIHIGARMPIDLAVDKSSGLLYLSTRACAPAAPGCILIVDPSNGTMLKSIDLSATPGELRIDSDLGLLFVALPELQQIAVVDLRRGRVLNGQDPNYPDRTIRNVPQTTSLALDPLRHTLYAAHLAGQVTVIDVSQSRVTARISMTGAGLTSVATARGLVYGVNTATHELAVGEPITQTVTRYMLSQEPAAIAAAEDSGAVFVLTSRSDSILRIDPTDGSELNKVIVADRSGHGAIQPNDVQSLRPRLVINPVDDTLFATLPEAGSLAAVRNDSFPLLARDIPYPDLGDDQAAAVAIPDVLHPGGVSDDSFNAQGR